MLVNWKPRRSLFWYLARITWPPDLYLQCLFPSHFSSGENQIEIECIHSAPSPFLRQLDQELRMEYDVNDQPFSEVSPFVFLILVQCAAAFQISCRRWWNACPQATSKSPRSSWNSRSEQTFATFASFQSTLQARETNGRWYRIHLRWAGCEDVDDALSCEKLENGNFRVGARLLDYRIWCTLKKC